MFKIFLALIFLSCTSFASDAWYSGTGSRGITQAWIPFTSNGTGGMQLSNASGNSDVCAQSSSFGTGKFTCIQEATGTGGQVILGGTTHLWSTEGQLNFVISQGNFAGQNLFAINTDGVVVLQAGINTNYMNLWPGIGNGGFGEGENKTPINVPPVSSATIFNWAPDNVPSDIIMEFICSGGTSTGSDYWYFHREFHVQPTGITGGGATHTSWTELYSGNGTPIVADQVSSGLSGAALAFTTSGLGMTVTLNNPHASLTARITCEIWDSNGHIQ